MSGSGLAARGDLPWPHPMPPRADFLGYQPVPVRGSSLNRHWNFLIFGATTNGRAGIAFEVKFSLGGRQAGKAPGFGPGIRRFESFPPSHRNRPLEIEPRKRERARN
jgi:hypothetical protein